MLRVIGAVLLIAGILMLVYRGFSYTKEKHEARIVGINLKVEEKDRIEIPVWAGVLVTLAGGALLAAGSRRKD